MGALLVTAVSGLIFGAGSSHDLQEMARSELIPEIREAALVALDNRLFEVEHLLDKDTICEEGVSLSLSKTR